MKLDHLRPADHLPGQKIDRGKGIVEVEIGPAEQTVDIGYERSASAPEAAGGQAGAVASLEGIPLLGPLPARALAVFLARAEYRAVSPGEMVIREGASADQVYLVARGELAVARGTPPREVARLKQDSFFGELALLDDTPRSASVTAVTESELIVLPRELVFDICRQYPIIFEHLMQALRTRLVETLMVTSPLFGAIPDEERPSVVARFRYCEVEAGANLIVEGDRVGTLFLILAGRAEILSQGEVVNTLTTGEIIGELAFLSDRVAGATVRARSRLMALSLDAGALREVLSAYPRVGEMLSSLASSRHLETSHAPLGAARSLRDI